MTPRRKGGISPAKLAHVVFRTRQKDALLDWWTRVLQAEVVFDHPALAFLTYDDEHHRVAIVAIPDLEEAGPKSVGVDHIAFSYASLGDLLETYERLEREGISPVWCVNHGPTTSMYYRDPDGNRVELQIDNFPTERELRDFFRSDVFRKNPIGVPFDPKRLLERFRSGDSVEELVKQGSA